MGMSVVLWYLVALCGLMATSFLLWIIRHLVSEPRLFIARHLTLSSVWSPWIMMTRLSALILFAFVLANAFIVLYLSRGGLRSLEQQASILAVVNLAPLCLGGRAPILNSLNWPYAWYMRIHKLLGFVATLQIVVHVAIVLKLKPRIGLLTLSGWISFSLVCLSLLLTIPWSRRFFGTYWLLTHRVVSMAAISCIFWHTFLTSSSLARAIVGFSCGLWLATTMYRVTSVLHQWKRGSIMCYQHNVTAATVEIKTVRAVQVYPGCFFYVFLPGALLQYDLSHSVTGIALWRPATDAARMTNTIEFIFARNISSARWFGEGQSVLLDGPYGQRLELEKFETVVLVAKGMGIISVLPVALDIATRRKHDTEMRRSARVSEGNSALYRDSAKKVILFWSLESNDQVEWVAEHLKSLQALDPQNRLMVVWCGFPEYRTGHDPFAVSEHWRCLDPKQGKPFDEKIATTIHEERSRVPGKMAIYACGPSKFTSTLRNNIAHNLSNRLIHYFESDYMPGKPNRPVRGSIELGSM